MSGFSKHLYGARDVPAVRNVLKTFRETTNNIYKLKLAYMPWEAPEHDFDQILLNFRLARILVGSRDSGG